VVPEVWAEILPSNQEEQGTFEFGKLTTSLTVLLKKWSIPVCKLASASVDSIYLALFIIYIRSLFMND
jgi:hypothetical protein